MTEAEWNSCTDPRQLLETARGRMTDRDLRMFGVACVRRIWHLMRDERHRQAVEVAERFAEGRANRDELIAAKAAITDIPLVMPREPGDHGAMAAAWYVSGNDAWYAAWYASRHAAEAIGDVAMADSGIALQGAADAYAAALLQRKTVKTRAQDLESAAQAEVVRQIVQWLPSEE